MSLAYETNGRPQVVESEDRSDEAAASTAEALTVLVFGSHNIRVGLYSLTMQRSCYLLEESALYHHALCKAVIGEIVASGVNPFATCLAG